ncbi:MAG: hypothetical protein JWP74_4164 [Marmoricola sp.]|nr:hypothetical protein [Marmoricola sp.]
MNKLNRWAVAGLVTVAVAVPVAVAPAAQARPAASRHWTVIETGFKAKQEACKVSVNHGHTWKIYNRLDSSKVTGGTLEATLRVIHNGNVARAWDSGKVKKHHVSKVGTVTLSKTNGDTLIMTLAAAQAGSGGPIAISKIKHC